MKTFDFPFIHLLDYQPFSLSLPAASGQLVTAPLPPPPLQPCPTHHTRPQSWRLPVTPDLPPSHAPSPSQRPLQRPQGGGRPWGGKFQSTLYLRGYRTLRGDLPHPWAAFWPQRSSVMMLCSLLRHEHCSMQVQCKYPS